jgi:hypothetical protein
MLRVTDKTASMAKVGWPAKIGTVPMVVQVHMADIARIAPGNEIRVKTGRPPFSGCKWERVLVREVDETTLHFQADRW